MCLSISIDTCTNAGAGEQIVCCQCSLGLVRSVVVIEGDLRTLSAKSESDSAASPLLLSIHPAPSASSRN